MHIEQENKMYAKKRKVAANLSSEQIVLVLGFALTLNLIIVFLLLFH